MFGSASIDLSGYLTDVQINGTSIVSDGVANVPIASVNDAGVAKVHPDYGITVFANTFKVNSANDARVKAGASGNCPIVPFNQHLATFYGLAKASGDTTQSQSSNAVGTYTEDAKSKIQNMLGITDKYSPKEWMAESETELVTNAHNVGDLFYIGETLYKVIADLNAGDAINVGVNVEEVDVNNILTDYATKEDVQDNISIVEKSASGAIASFPDGADDIPLKSLTVNIDPVQDLHGYDSPWVGGGGINLNPIESVGESDSAANRWYVAYRLPLSAGTYYTYTELLDGSNYTSGLYLSIDGGGYTRLGTNGGLPMKRSFAIENDAVITLYLSSSTIPSDVLARTAISKTDIDRWTPYENICPISGWTGCEVSATGKNLFDERNLPLAGFNLVTDPSSLDYGYYAGNAQELGIKSTSIFNRNNGGLTRKIPIGGQVTVSADMRRVDSRGWFRFYYTDGTNSGNGYQIDSGSEARHVSFASNAQKSVSAVAFITNGGSNSRLSFKNLQIEKSGAETAYEQFGRTIPISWQSEAGTIYGGKLDVLSGVLRVNRKIRTVDAISNVASAYIHSDGVNGYVLDSDIQPRLNPMLQSTQYCNKLKFQAKAIWTDGISEPNVFAINQSQIHIKIANDLLGITDYTQETTTTAKEKLNAWLAENPVTLTIPIEPIEIQLTPHEVRSLLGQNNIFADTGDSAVEYFSQVDEDLIDYIEISLKPYAKEEKLNDYVSDVQVNGTSIVTNNVANVPIATQSVIGALYTASEADGKVGTHTYCAIVPKMQHSSVFYGLAKAAGDVTQSQSSNAVGTYTDEAKTAIKQMLGIHDTIDSFVEEVTGTDVTITGQPSYRYNCGEVLSLTVTPPETGTIDFRFTSGSTPTVLTLPQTVKMPEWWVEVEANTIYEMCITDGIYCGVMSWAV